MVRPNSEKYAKVFRKSATFQAIKNIQVQEMDMIGTMKIVLTLWDETSMTSSLPGWLCTSEDKDFIVYYVDEVLAHILNGQDPSNQAVIDKILDHHIANISLEELEKLARNVNWAVSMVVCKAGAHCEKTSAYKYVARLAVDQQKKTTDNVDPDFLTPNPYLNVTLGGLHVEKRLADQHLVISHLNPRSFNDATRVIQKVYEEYSKVRNGEIGIEDGDEVSYTPSIDKIRNCLTSLKMIIEELGLRDEVSIGLNIGASKFYQYDKKNYRLNFSEESSESLVEMSANALYKAYLSLRREFKGMKAFEDMFHMEDKEYASKLTRGVTSQLVITEFDCDDFDEAMSKRVFNCLHLKVGQIGSVTKCIRYVVDAKRAERSIVLSSHGSCETSEPFLADFCIGLSLDQIKIGVSCFTSACNICNRLRELEVERAEEEWRRYPISLSDHRVKTALAMFRNEPPPVPGLDADMLETRKKCHFKEVTKIRNELTHCWSPHTPLSLHN